MAGPHGTQLHSPDVQWYRAGGTPHPTLSLLPTVGRLYYAGLLAPPPLDVSTHNSTLSRGSGVTGTPLAERFTTHLTRLYGTPTLPQVKETAWRVFWDGLLCGQARWQT